MTRGIILHSNIVYMATCVRQFWGCLLLNNFLLQEVGLRNATGREPQYSLADVHRELQ